MLTRRLIVIIIITAVLIGAGVILMIGPGQDHTTPYGLLFDMPRGFLSGNPSQTSLTSYHLKQFCIAPSGQDKLLPRLWAVVTNETGVDDASAVLLDFSMSGTPGRMPKTLQFSFSSKKDWWTGSRRVVLIGNESGNCGGFAIAPSRESPDISGEDVPRPGRLFDELEQVLSSDMGVGGKRLIIGTSVRYDPPYNTSDRLFLLTNGSVVPLREITFDRKKALVYPWSIRIMECTGKPGEQECGTSETGPAIWVFSEDRLKGTEYRTG